MINIISRSYVAKNITGPQKVVTNLIKGLDILGYPYCINKDLDATSQLWIHDDPVALKKASTKKLKAVVGPNIYILPRNIPSNIGMSTFVYIHPSKWICDFWKDLGFKDCPLDFWPSAIDTNEFSERKKPENGKVLIYFKQRFKNELDFVKDILDDNKIQYEIISYGTYKQDEYVNKLKNTRYVIWLGRHETQGIALEEALSMNIPMVVWDVSSVGQWIPRRREKNIFTKKESEYKNTSSAYYFDNRCGIKIKNQNEITLAIEKMELEWKNFNPRQYIIENLGLEKQARELISLYTKYFSIKYDQGKIEIPKNNNKWRNDYWQFKIFSSLKIIIKRILGRRG